MLHAHKTLYNVIGRYKYVCTNKHHNLVVGLGQTTISNDQTLRFLWVPGYSIYTHIFVFKLSFQITEKS